MREYCTKVITLTCMRVPSIRVRPTVQRTAGSGVRFRVAPSRQYEGNGCYDTDH